MLPRHRIRFAVDLPFLLLGLLVDGLSDPPAALAGMVLFGVAMFDLLVGLCSWIGWLAYRAALRRHGFDPDAPTRAVPAMAARPRRNDTLVFGRPFAPGRAPVPGAAGRPAGAHRSDGRTFEVST